MVADFHHGALIHHHNHVGGTDGREAVGDEEHRAAAEGLEQIAADLPFGAGVEGTGGLIEDQHAGVLQHRPSQGHALPLTTGQSSPPFADRAVVALRQLHDEVVGAGDPGGPD